MKLSSLLLLTLPHLKHASETCEWSFTRAEELRVASVNAGTDRDPSVQDLVFQAFRDAIACDPNDGDSWVRLVFLSPYEADRAVLPHAPASYVSSHIDRECTRANSAASSVISSFRKSSFGVTIKIE